MSRNMTPVHDGEFRNWGDNQSARPRQIHLPRTQRDVVELVDRVRTAGETMRVVGAGHSWTDIACTDRHLVSLDEMRGVIRLDRRAETVTVRAGTRLHELIDHLDARGFALPNLGSVAQQSIAGVISTGTHGTGIEFGNLSTLVRSMRLVTGRGDVLEVDAESDPELFDATRIGLGALGVITRVTLDCVPAFNLHERAWTLPFEDALRQMPDLVDHHEHLKFWWLPYTGQIQVYAADRTRRLPTKQGLVERIDESGLLRPVFASVLDLEARRPAWVPLLNHIIAAAYLTDRDHVAPSHRVFKVPMPPTHLESEYGVALTDAPDVLRELRAFIEWEQLPANFVNEVRFVAADDLWLSPAYERTSCQIGAYIGHTPGWRDYFEGFADIAERRDGRPHWGKTFFAGHEELSRVYPRLDDFERVRRELDPDGLFVNDFIGRVFGLGDASA